MVEDLPHIAELDLNPVLVGAEGAGAIALDARIRLARPSAPPHGGPERLEARAARVVRVDRAAGRRLTEKGRPQLQA